ncbi:MAG: AraC family transcriptional regulator [Planctomycetota bacterium]
MTDAPTATIRDLLAAARRLTGLRVIFRDLSGRSGLDVEWMYHQDSACQRMRVGRQGAATCVGFCAGSVLRDMAAHAQARVHVCPFGFTEIVVPVQRREHLLGVLYAGPCHVGSGKAEADLVPVPNPTWLADRQLLLEALALRLGDVLDGARALGDDRPALIIAWIEAGLSGTLPLAGLAQHLGLSSSRCGHHVKELFGVTFPTLVRRTRMQAAARMLAKDGVSVAAAAQRVGCRDMDWFSRQFRGVHGCTPAVWRERSRSA